MADTKLQKYKEKVFQINTGIRFKSKARYTPCTGTEALYRPYGP
jgi:hypothetical protein